MTADVAPVDAWILTGMSGAGKSTAARALEAAGVDVVDNLGVDLLAGWAAPGRARPAAAVVDARQGEAIAGLIPPDGVRVLYLTAPDPVLLRRLAESTRPHPCGDAGGPAAAVRREHELLTGLRAAADTVIDTGELSPAELGRRVVALLAPPEGAAPLRLLISSFGYKFGPQAEADWVADVRFLRNPFWDPELRPRTGLDEAVRDYVLADPHTDELCERLGELLSWASAHYASNGRRHLHVAVGCTGGRHRSVVVAEELGRRLRSENLDVTVRHRDVGKPDPR
ncbi:MAG: RNase adapter RapZ [Candidatus Dormibacteria bacterium]|jgi:UPF0042 nucleotide-binding protein